MTLAKDDEEDFIQVETTVGGWGCCFNRVERSDSTPNTGQVKIMANEQDGGRETGSYTEETSGIVGLLLDLLRRILAEGKQA